MRGCVVVVALASFAACGPSAKAKPDSGGPGDGGGIDAPVASEVTCQTLAPVGSGTCEITAGSAAKLIEGEVVTPTTVYHGGEVAVSAVGLVTCVGCDCAKGGETVISCPDATVSPGLIDTHDHITFSENSPMTPTSERWDDRQQWREGLDGHTALNAPGNASADEIRWASSGTCSPARPRSSRRAARPGSCATSTSRPKRAASA